MDAAEDLAGLDDRARFAFKKRQELISAGPVDAGKPEDMDGQIALPKKIE